MVWRVLAILLTLVYPVLIYFSLGRLAIWHMALLLGVMALARYLAEPNRFWLCAGIGVLLLATIAACTDSLLMIKLYPVLVNALMLLLFVSSLIYPPSAIERLARLQEPDLDAFGVAYTRRITQVWVVFFVLNLTAALYTALFCSERVWALYNGMIAYLLMGVLFAAEYLVRRRVRAAH